MVAGGEDVGDGGDVLVGEGGDAGEVGEEVEKDAFGGEECAGGSGDFCEGLVEGGLGGVWGEELEGGGWAVEGEDVGDEEGAGDGAGFSGEDGGGGGVVGWDGELCGLVDFVWKKNPVDMRPWWPTAVACRKRLRPKQSTLQQKEGRLA